MMTVKVGDLFESEAQTLVNTVNCVGVMGKGVALEFKRRFPEMYADYVARCAAGQVRLGQPYLVRRLMPPWILNFPTKDHWRSVSRLEDIVAGLEYLKENYRRWGIESLAVPPLGCGNGQLEWRVVGPTLYRHLQALEIPVELFAPFGTPHDELSAAFLDHRGSDSHSEVPYHIEPAWMAIVEILRRIDDEPYHWPVGRVTFQKIAYFATAAGLPTGLQFERGSYGPYALALKSHLSALANNGLVYEERLGQMLAIRVGETFADAMPAYATLIEAWRPIIEKVADLFMRMNTQRAEVAATVHFAAHELLDANAPAPTEQDVLNAVMSWKQRRRPPLAEGEVAEAVRHLNILSWLGVAVSPELAVADEDLALA